VELVQRHQHLAYATAYSILGDRQSAEDATQEAFVAAWQSLASLADPAAFPVWLRAIVRHQAHRQLRRRQPMVALNAAEIAASSGPGPTDIAACREHADYILAAISTLPRSEREVTYLFYIHSHTQEEVARFLGVSVSAVNNRLHSARLSLKEKVKNMTPRTIENLALPEDFADRVGRVIGLRGGLVDVKFANSTPGVFERIDVPGSDLRLRVAQRLEDGVVRCLPEGELADVQAGAVARFENEVDRNTASDEQLRRAVKSVAPPAAENGRIVWTGIKSLDFLCPVVHGGSLGLYGIQGVGRIVLVQELIHRLRGTGAGVTIFYLVSPHEPEMVRDMLRKEKTYPGDASDSLNVFWLLSDSANDPGAAIRHGTFDVSVYCSPMQAVQGLWPAIDPLACSVPPGLLEDRHANAVARVQTELAEAREIMADRVFLELLACRAERAARQRLAEWVPRRLGELSHEKRRQVLRARKVERYLTTLFSVAEPYTGKPGVSVGIADTIVDVHQILDGAFDDVDEARFIGISRAVEAK
jgi:RNA polymerase sigma factor (sigma-70 family)